MFRRLWSGLPKDPEFPSDLNELGYFINNDDQIVSIQDPQYFFKFFLTRNERHNDRQRFAMNEAIEKEVHKRLQNEGLVKVQLPLGTADTGRPNVPIFVSKDLKLKKRIIVIFGESVQDLGVLAHRVLGSISGVNRGSMVSIIKEIKKLPTSSSDNETPGILLANMGQLQWWPGSSHKAEYSGKAMNSMNFQSVRMKSAVHEGVSFDPKINPIPGNETPYHHVEYIFEKVLTNSELVSPSARLDIIALGDGAEYFEHYISRSDATFAPWQKRLNSFVSVGGQYHINAVKSDSFKTFLRTKSRAYIICQQPLDTLIAGPDGNPNTSLFTSMGCPVYSSGEPRITENMFILAHPSILGWIQKIALTPGGAEKHKNADIYEVTFRDQNPAHCEKGDGWDYVEPVESDNGNSREENLADNIAEMKLVSDYWREKAKQNAKQHPATSGDIASGGDEEDHPTVANS